jgi:hypothetical protein
VTGARRHLQAVSTAAVPARRGRDAKKTSGRTGRQRPGHPAEGTGPVERPGQHQPKKGDSLMAKKTAKAAKPAAKKKTAKKR